MNTKKYYNAYHAFTVCTHSDAMMAGHKDL